eukprot:3001796-Alexandrium_andersonii.AAC.1
MKHVPACYNVPCGADYATALLWLLLYCAVPACALCACNEPVLPHVLATYGLRYMRECLWIAWPMNF